MKISTLMSVYHAEKPENLADSLESLCAQKIPANELILVEDGKISSELIGVIETYRDRLRIKSVKIEKNVGLAAALNEGLKYCENELIARMDSDDVALPNRFSVQYDFLIKNDDIAACSSYVEEFFEGTKKVTVRKVPTCHAEIVKYAKFRTPLSHPAAMYRRSAVCALGGYPQLYPEDQAFWALMISQGYRLANIPEVLLRMRTNEFFFDRRGWKLFRGQINVLNFRRRLHQVSRWEYVLNVLFLFAIRLPPRFIRAAMFNISRG
jgi:glycosyltransferase involved in cell wall biosynthesis